MRLALVASFALLALLMMTLEVGFASAHSQGHDRSDYYSLWPKAAN